MPHHPLVYKDFQEEILDAQGISKTDHCFVQGKFWKAIHLLQISIAAATVDSVAYILPQCINDEVLQHSRHNYYIPHKRQFTYTS